MDFLYDDRRLSRSVELPCEFWIRRRGGPALNKMGQICRGPRTRVETEQQKHQSQAFQALNFSIRAISSKMFGYGYLIRAISSRKMVKHFDHKKISSDRRAISSIIFENFGANSSIIQAKPSIF